jgi:hypothetical protein
MRGLQDKIAGVAGAAPGNIGGATAFRLAQEGMKNQMVRNSSMTAPSEVSKALDQAFRAASLLTGSAEVAENAVLDGIDALEFDKPVDDVLLVETVKSAIRRRVAFSGLSEQAHLPLELQRLFLLAPISRDCFILRVLLGITAWTCSNILHLGVEEIEVVLCAALQELPLLEACC